ncbi:DUF6284 family protein [Streptomyces sp. NPDC001455]|uniref:DUF6284 family protein n=1 Tax=Streptomyces sp. NPDC001455 TaxID=3154518 RepID=UPI0033231FBC
MAHIVTLQAAVTVPPPGGGPSAADLAAIEREMPLILAEVDLLDVEIAVLDRPATVLDERRVRRARNRVLAERRNLTNRAVSVLAGGAA